MPPAVQRDHLPACLCDRKKREEVIALLALEVVTVQG